MTAITLSKSVEHGGITYSKLTFREATIGDLMAGDAVSGELTKTIAILASVSDTPLPAFKKISAKDMTAILGATSDLLGNDLTATTGD